MPTNIIVEHHKNYTYCSIFRSSVSGDVLTRNVKIIAEGLARHIFNMTENNTVSEITRYNMQYIDCSLSLTLSPPLFLFPLV